MKTDRLMILALVAVALVTGCDDDERVAQIAREAADRQARQSEEMARLSEQTAEATKRLVEADAQAHQEMLAMQRELQAEQAEVGRQRDQLETERRELAQDRWWDSLTATAVTNVGLILACLLPLVLCWHFLRAVRNENDDALVNEVLIEELTSDQPRLLPPPDAASLGGDSSPRAALPGDLDPSPENARRS